MTAEVDLCNDALAQIGKKPLNDIEDPEPAARRCKELLPRTLRELQARFSWGHNVTSRKIAAKAEPSNMPGFLYAHKLPADYLRFDCVLPGEGSGEASLDRTFTATDATPTRSTPIKKRVASGYIHTNCTPIELVYHRHETQVGTLPELFRAALTAQLAAKLAFPLTRDTKIAAEMKEIAREAIMFAQNEEDIDEDHQMPQGSTFLDARA